MKTTKLYHIVLTCLITILYFFISNFVFPPQLALASPAENNSFSSFNLASALSPEKDEGSSSSNEMEKNADTGFSAPSSLSRLQALALQWRMSSSKQAESSEGDGTKIEQVSVEWMTKDTPQDDNDNARLLVTPSDDTKFAIQLRINFALSGQYDYEPGDVRVTVPKEILKARDDSIAGNWTLSVPEDPNHKALFAYTETDDAYVFTNTKKLSAATQAMMEMSLRNITPHEVNGNPSAYETDPFTAKVEIITHSGNVLSKTSNSITARFDTAEKVSFAQDRAVNWQTSYPDDWPSDLKPSNPDDYVYVDFYSYAYQYGNQAYNMSETHTVSSDDLPGGVVLGMQDGNGTLYTGDGTATISAILSKTEYTPKAPSHFTHAYAAWPKANLDSDNPATYHVRDDVTYSLTSIDDQETTTSSANAMLSISYMPFSTPTGHFITSKKGETDAATGLNQLDQGKDARVTYEINNHAFTGPWTWTDTNHDASVQQDELGKRYVRLDTYDDQISLDGTTLEPDDYDMDSVIIDRPVIMDYVQFTRFGFGYREPNSNYGTTNVTYGIIPTGTWGYRTTLDNTQIPDQTILAYVNNAWITAGTISWKTGSPALTGANPDVSLTGTTLTLPKGTKQIRTTLETNASAIFTSLHPSVTVHPTETTQKIARDHLVGEERPSTDIINRAWTDYTQKETGTVIDHEPYRYGMDKLKGVFQGSRLEKKLEYDNDVSNRQVTLHYTSSLREQSNARTNAELEIARNADSITDETSGTFYDLLPRGVTPVISSVKATNTSDTVTSARTIDNYKDSGRTLLVAKVSLTPNRVFSYRNATDNILNQDGLMDTHTITFDAIYSWESMTDYGTHLTNVIAYESDNSWVGNVKGLSGEPDNPTFGNHTDSKPSTLGVETIMTDLDPSRDDPSFVYASVASDIHVDTAALTSLSKRVAVNGSGTYSTGLDDDELNVYESGRYDYRLRVENDADTKSEDIVIYDNLEQYIPTPDKNDNGDKQWTGTFQSIDTSQLEDKGIAPAIYYSTRSDLVLDDTTNRTDMNLMDKSIWSTTKPDNPKSIKAIAIDCSKTADGNTFTLDASDSIVAYVRMKSPRASDINVNNPEKVFDTTLETGQNESDDDGWCGGAHAYNNVTMLSTSISTKTGDRSENQLIRNDYVKVGLIPYSIHIEKSFDDANDQDGLRPSSIIARLVADGQPTNKTTTLNASNDWQATFDADPTDDDGNLINYTIQEDDPGAYTPGETASYDINKGAWSISVTNRYTPETTSISGTKTWDDEGHENARPHVIVIDLYQDGKHYTSTATSANNNWNYSFDGLPKYHDHGIPYDYTIAEDTYYEGYITSITGTNVKNTYYPYGNLTIEKTIKNATPESQDAEHSFSLTLTNSDGEPDPTSYTYETSDGRSGKIGNGGNITLKGGQSATIYDITSSDTYTWNETPAAGYTQTSATNETGTIYAGKTSNASFTDSYDASGSITIHANKTLTGHDMTRYQFRFDLLDTNGTVLRSATNDDEGNVSFGRLHYTLSDVGKTFRYIIRENNTGKKGYSYDNHVEPVIVTIIDNGDGTLTANPTYDADGAIFTNAYHAKGTTKLVAWKTLLGRTLKDGEFKFELSDDDTGTPLSTATSRADGTITFPTINYDETDAGKTFHYTAKEIAGSDTTINYTNMIYHYTVTVIDNDDGTLTCTQTVKTTPTFQNTQKPGSLRIEKRVQSGDPTSEFKFHVIITQPNGEPLPDGTHDFKREQIQNENETNNTNTENTNENTLENAAGTIKQLLQPKTAEAEEYDNPTNDNIKTYTITYKTDAGTFSNGTDTNTVTYNKTYHNATTTKYSHTPNIDNSGNANGTYASNLSLNDIVTIPGATKLTIDIWYSTESTSYDWLAIYPTGVTPSNTNYSFASISNGKLGGGAKSSKDNATHATYTVDGDTAQFYFKSDDSNNYYGYYAIVTDESENAIVTDGSYEEPSRLPDGYEWYGWFSDESHSTQIDPTTLTDNTTVYGHASLYKHTGTCGSVSWGIKQTGELHFWPTNGHEGTFASNSSNSYTFWPWYSYASTITSITSEGTLHGFNSMSYMFYNCSNLTSLDLSSFDTSNVTSMNYMFENCSNLTSLDLSSFDTSNVTSMSNMFFNCSNLTSLDLSSFDTSNVTSMNYMFYNCSKLTSLDLSSFDTSNVTSMSGMFVLCSKLSCVVIGPEVTADCVGLLPSPSVTLSGDKSTGKWIREDQTYGPYTVANLAANWNDTYMPGVWVAEEVLTKYTVDFDANGGEGSMASVRIDTTAGVTNMIQDSSFYYFDHTFTGWNTKADGTGVSYVPTDNFSGRIRNELTGKDAQPGETVTLYAQWMQNVNEVVVQNGQFDVTLHGNEAVTLDDLPAGSGYVVYEETPSGWVVVDSKDVAGTIQSTETSTAGFMNDYQSGKAQVTLTGRKVLDGVPDGTAAFSFSLYEGNDLIETVSDGVGGGIVFSPITYDAVGTHVYTICENVGDDSTIDYDSHAETVTVDVSSDGQGNLVAVASTDDDGVVFANETKPGSLAITKKVVGTSDGSVVFTVHVDFTDGTSKSVQLRANDTVTLDGLKPGLGYTVSESDFPDGYVLDAIDNATGVIVADRTLTSTVTNDYHATGTATIEATKTLEGGTLEDGEFDFVLYEGDGLVATATNTANGAVVFDSISYDAPGEHDYTIREIDPAVLGIVSDTHVATAHVSVVDDGVGHLVTKVAYGVGDSAPDFVNRVVPAELTLMKQWVNAPDGSSRVATFDIALTSSDDVSYENDVMAYFYKSVDDDDPERLMFTPDGGIITVEHVFDDDSRLVLMLPMGVSYTIIERPVHGYVTSYCVGGSDVDSDRVHGRLVGDETVDVINTYAATGVWTPTVAKHLLGKDLESGEFVFTLVDSRGNVVEHASNDSDGNVLFDPIGLSDPGVLKTYYLYEENTNEPHVVYDQRIVRVNVSCSDDGNGSLVPVVSYDSGSVPPTFENSYIDSVVLPLTGNNGMLIVAIIGINFICLGFYVYLRKRY